MEVKTKILQKMLDKVMKGVVDNKIVPITSLIGIDLEDGVLSITATDRINFIRVLEDEIKGANFKATILAQQFNKLIQRITVDNISIVLKDNYLEVKAGTGKYKIELPLEGEDLIVYPDIPDIKASSKGTLSMKDVKSLLETNKVCLAKNNSEYRWLEGYHISKDCAITGDSRIAAINSVKLFETSFLLCKECVELLDVIQEDEVYYTRDGDQLLFESNNVSIYTIELEDEENYPYDSIKDFFKGIEKSSYCQLPKDELLSVLDRISLFVGEYDQNDIQLNFSKGGLSVKSKKVTGAEIIKYVKHQNIKAFECEIDLELFKSIVSVQPKGVFDLYFGNENCLRILGLNTKHLIALSENKDSSGVAIKVDLDDENIPF